MNDLYPTCRHRDLSEEKRTNSFATVEKANKPDDFFSSVV